jgi:hypothetical protein
MAKKVFITMLLALCLFSVSSSAVLADNALVQCGRTKDVWNGSLTAQQQAQDCNFAAAVQMINDIINYLIMISMPLAAIAFAYAGWLYLSAGDDTGKVKKAHEIFLSVGVGVIVILSGWLLFKLISTTFLNPSSGYGTYLN